MTTITMPQSASALPSQDKVMLVAMVVLWGMSWPAMKLAVGFAPPLWLAVFRFASSSICLFAFLAIRKQLVIPCRRDMPIVLSVGILQMAAFTGLGMVAMQYTDAGKAALLAYSTPLWAVMIGSMFFAQKLNPTQKVALLFGIGGIAVVCSPMEVDWSNSSVIMGNGFLLLAAICWSIVILHVRAHKWIAKPIQLAPWQMLLATIVLLSVTPISPQGVSDIKWNPELVGLLFYFGPIATSFCFVISTDVGRRLTAFTMSNVTLGVPVVGMLSSLFLLSESLSLPLAVGFVLILTGIGLATYAAKQSSAH
ncbi:DMT family transporter [Agrobacterium vitis]|uniref:DMT family transporter n=1 Tax=Agrobacterium vitis TaxID=373 RepID=UPI0012E8F054|nr:DMT family transporter [Agrobacterium vitis]MUZ66133.1 EamA family transporter [Agrobacterium vitis]